MSLNNSATSPTFGQLNWNISQSTSSTLHSITDYFNYAGVFFEITVIIFFVVNFCTKKSTFRQPYFIIYTMGCVVDAMPKFQIFVNQYLFYGNKVYIYVMPFLNWYNANFITLCNLILAFNRFSAIVFPLYFSRIWTKRKTTIICILIALYPFIIHSFNPVLMYYIFTGKPLTKDVTETNFEYIFTFASDIAFAVLATLCGCTAAIQMIVQNKMKNKNVERVLLGQSITSSVFLIFSTVTAWLASVNKYTSSVTYMPEILRLIALQGFFLHFSKLFYSFHHYIGLLLLVTMSRNFRDNFFEFYKLNILFKKVKTIYKSDVSTVTVLNSSMASTSKKSTIFRSFSTSY